MWAEVTHQNTYTFLLGVKIGKMPLENSLALSGEVEGAHTCDPVSQS